MNSPDTKCFLGRLGGTRGRTGRGAGWMAVAWLAVAAVGTARGVPPWEAMDYGPFFSATIEAPAPRTNFAYKGIAVNLGRGAGSTAGEAIVFDTDLLRYAAGWAGDFVALKGVAFDGEHWAWPKTAGRQVFGNPMLPGWAFGGSYADPRELPYGPLRREHAHWNGLHVHGDDVVFDYSVGGMEVLEQPGIEGEDGQRAFSRTLNLGPSAVEQGLQVVFEVGRKGELRRWRGTGAVGNGTPADEVLAVLPAPRRLEVPAHQLESGLLGRWDFETDEAGTVPDRSGSGRALVLRGARLADGGTTGRGLALEKGQFAEIRDAGPIDPARGALTVAAWIRTTEDGVVLARAAGSGPWARGAVAFFVRGGKPTFDVGWVGAVTASRSVTDGDWHHLGLVWSPGDGGVSLYVDGQAEAAGRLAAGAVLASPVVRVGFAATNFPAAPWFQGTLDDLRVYGRALDPAEMAVLAGRRAEGETVAAAVRGAPAGTRWQATAEGHLRLTLPPRPERVKMKILIWRGVDGDLPRFVDAAGRSGPAADLASRTGGGPTRWPARLETPIRPSTAGGAGAFTVEELVAPDDNPWKSWLRFGAVDLFPDGERAAISTWNGDVWLVSGLGAGSARLSWQRIATGLYQPLGLKIVDGRIHVLGRDQVTVLEDRNGDGETDFYRNFNNDCQVGEHFHEFATDLKLGPDGDFYYVKCARHALPAAHAHHGTVLRLSRDGSKLEVVARGFRAVNGLGVGPAGEITTIDNQGHWMPANRLNWVVPGGWYGNQWAWNPSGRTDYDPPLCWMHNFVDRSGGTQLWVPGEGWGPLGGELITISYGMGHLFLVLKEQVDGVMQGAVTRLPFDFETGVMRGAFHPRTHDLYLCGLYGWAGNKTKPGGFYRIRPTGQPMHLPTRLQVARDGLVLGFAEPLDPSTATDPGRYDLKAWDYRWTANYGSPDLKRDGTEGRDTWRVAAATLSADRRTVFLAVPDLRKVMQYHLVFDLKAADGLPVQNFVHGTVHRIGGSDGATLLGAGALAREATTEGDPAPANLASGLELAIGRPGEAWRDHRVVRQAALHVAPGQPASPYLAPGPFRARWRGFLKLDLSEDLGFAFEGKGRVRLRVGGTEVFEASGPDLGAAGPKTVALTRGLNRFELEYTSPPDGEAMLRLTWSSRQVAWEPVPATAWFHDDGDPELREARPRRLGRELFADRQCGRCHAGDGWREPGAMPELAAEAASFAGIGDRLQADWMAQWLLDPRRFRSDARMPRLLAGPETNRDAADLAAALAGLREPAAATRNPDPGLSATGARLFTDLGCAGCHALPGEPALPADRRVALAPVSAKWRPEALPEFLRRPAAKHTWTRMPDFALTAAEAEALAAFLLDRTRNAAGVAGALGPATDPGDPRRGRVLLKDRGCLNCHTLPGETSGLVAPSLERIVPGAEAGRGCLAQDAGARGSAPHFVWEGGDRDAVRAFLKGPDAAGALRRDPVDEFAVRQYTALRCGACHPRDQETDLLSTLSAAAGSGAAAGGDEEEAAAAGSVHVGRPLLSFTGEKLYAGWMERLFAGTLRTKTRPELAGRMPAFAAYAQGLAAGLAAEHGHGFEEAPRLAVDPAKAEVGRRLTLVDGGFSCVACHNVGDQRALAGKDTATVNFAVVAGRLRPTYYWRYLRDPSRVVPATMMPKFIGEDGTTPIKAVFDGDPARQFDAVWHYLHALRPVDER